MTHEAIKTTILDGKTALDIAVGGKRMDIIHILLDHSPRDFCSMQIDDSLLEWATRPEDTRYCEDEAGAAHQHKVSTLPFRASLGSIGCGCLPRRICHGPKTTAWPFPLPDRGSES